MYNFDRKVTRSLVIRLGPYARLGANWGLNREPSTSNYNVIKHYATLLYISPIFHSPLIRNINFRFRLFPGKTNMTKFFKKSKKTYFGPFSALFARIWAKMNFPGDKGSVSFQLTSYSNYSIDIKNQKKTNDQFLKKCRTSGRTHRQTTLRRTGIQ